jgi:hypothetical protein
MAGKKTGGSRNNNRPNGKAWKKNPGSDGVKVKHNVLLLRHLNRGFSSMLCR